MIFAEFAVCLVVFAVGAFAAEAECDKSKCAGPLHYYEDLKCTPVYADESSSSSPNDCCPISYDCSHLQGRFDDRCYANGREYGPGAKLLEEDRATPCDVGCVCQKNGDEAAFFTCAGVDCVDTMHAKEGCYIRKSLDSCCGGEEVCLNKTEERAKCEVDGETYLDGEEFTPKSDPSMVCNCMKGYKGENIAPFCRKVSCGTEISRAREIRENCVPVFYSNQSPLTSCSHAFRCQNHNDTIISKSKKKPTANKKSSESDEMEEFDWVGNKMAARCSFGNMIMEIGDELNQATDYSSVCVRCVCEVPPMPTCRRLPDDECDVTQHPNFD